MFRYQRENSRLSFSFSSELPLVDLACREADWVLRGHGLQERLFAVQLLLRETLNNAVIHGNGLDARKMVGCELDLSGGAILLSVNDEGEGFDWRRHYPPEEDDPLLSELGDPELSTSGYGMRILENYADEAHFNDKGNVITIRIFNVEEGAVHMSTIQRVDQRAVVRPVNNIVVSQVQQLRGELKQLIEDGVREVVVDLAQVLMIDSIGLGVLIATHNSLKKVGGLLAVENASRDLFDLFRSMRLTQHFSVTPAEQVQ
jgi:serine/threonine-protein kinase RsbW